MQSVVLFAEERYWYSQVLVDQGHPQYIMVSLMSLSLRLEPHAR